MRSVLRVLVVGAFAAGTIGVSALGAGAGLTPLGNTVTVVKQVAGTAPAGTTFTVVVECADIFDDVGTSAVSQTEITFDSTGQPTSADQVGVDAGTECTATETVGGSAQSVAYACELEPEPVDAECTTANSVEFGRVTGAAATITVTNQFPAPQPPPAPPVIQAIQATPTFTG